MTELKAVYQQRYETVLRPVASALEKQLHEYLEGAERIDRIAARAKSIDRFLAKSQKIENGVPKYVEPLRQIQDQIGVRIITFYISDIDNVAKVVQRYYRPIETHALVPESESEFGYFGLHYVLHVPTDVIEPSMDREMVPEFFELQIKTLFQHAWAEAGHDLGYKPGETPLSSDAKRRLAFASAQAWGADRIFDDLFRERAESGAISSGGLGGDEARGRDEESGEASVSFAKGWGN
jgi:ppGpp synthetase/RelA/SpoT-type nucleotidyltranferase